MRYSVLLVALLTIVMSGCSVEVESYEVNAAVKACENHGGVSNINTFGNLTTTCQDGFSKYLFEVYSGK